MSAEGDEKDDALARLFRLSVQAKLFGETVHVISRVITFGTGEELNAAMRAIPLLEQCFRSDAIQQEIRALDELTAKRQSESGLQGESDV